MQLRLGLAAKLILVNLAVILLAVSLSVAVHTSMLREYAYAQRERELIAGAGQITQVAVQYLEGTIDRPTVDYVLASLDEVLDARIRLVDLQGRILRGSRGERSMEREHSFVPRESFDDLLEGEIVTYERTHPRFGEAMLSVAVPIRQNGNTANSEVTGALLLHAPVTGIRQTAARLQRFGLLSAGFALLLAAGLGYVFFRRISRPLTTMSEVALDMAEGNFDRRVPVRGEDEVGRLARSLNQMAAGLSRTIASLQREKEKFISTVMSMNEGVMGVNAEGEVFLINPAAARLLSMSDSGVLRRPVHHRRLGAPTALADLIEDSLRTAEGRSEIVTLAGDRVCEVQVTPNEGSSEDDRGCVVLLHDISEAHRLEQMRRQFLADASHELRTPLAVIAGFLEALHDGTVAGEEIDHYISLMRAESSRLNRLVEDMLDLDKYDAGEILLSPRPTHLPDLLRQVAEVMDPMAEQRNVELRTEHPEDLPRAWADPDAVERILFNLVDNALRHTPAGGTVTLSAKEKEDQMQVTVRDTGEGIPPEKVPHIFERFFKADESRRRDSSGTGLGLAIVKRLVDAHGGRVWVESQPGAGTSFRFTLPTTNS